MDTDTPFLRLDRIRLDFFQDDNEGAFAARLGVSKQTYSTWKGARGLTPRPIPKILDKLSANGVHVTSYWLLFGKGERPRRGHAPPPRHADMHIARVIELMEATDERGRMEAFAAVRESLREYHRADALSFPAKKIGAS